MTSGPPRPAAATICSSSGLISRVEHKNGEDSDALLRAGSTRMQAGSCTKGTKSDAGSYCLVTISKT